MYRTNLRLVAAGAALASLLALTGCGGSDDKSSASAGSASTSSSDSTASSDSTDGSKDGKDGKDAKGDKGKGSGDSTDGSDGSSDSTDDSSDGSDDKTQAPVPMPKDFPAEVPVVDGDVVTGNYSKKPLGWNVTIRAGKDVSKEYDAAAKVLTDSGCKVEVAKIANGMSSAGQLTCGKYQVLLASTVQGGIVVTYSVSPK